MSLSEIRDNGPFHSPDQAMKQWASWSRNMPLPMADTVNVLLAEVAMMTGVKPTGFEREYLSAAELDPIAAQVVAGWIVRAYMAGQKSA